MSIMRYRMRFTVVIQTLAVSLLLSSAALLPPAAVSLLYRDGLIDTFALACIATGTTGAIFLALFRHRPRTIRNRDGFIVVALMWATMGVVGAVPFLLVLDITFTDALFEAVSGYTTTGATVIVGLDGLPASILFYRQEIQWLGGIGVIVLAVALLPMMSVGGMQIYKAETPGPVKDERMTPRIAGTARTLCLLYIGMTAVCAASYWLGGMTGFDAISHSLTTLSTGGFSTHDASFGYFDDRLIESIAIVFMLAGGISFNVHFLAWRTLRLAPYARNTQVRTFLLLTLAIIATVTVVLYGTILPDSLAESFRRAAFEVVSIITSTGFGIDDFSIWPLALPVMLIFASFIGACAGSTTGGIKVIRFVILAKVGALHIHRLIHPRAVRPVRVDGKVVADSVIEGIWGFFALYVCAFAAFMLLLMMGGMDQITAFGAVATCMNNLGPGLGAVSANFVDVGAAEKLILTFAMLLGRLEIFTILVLLTPAFWRA